MYVTTDLTLCSKVVKVILYCNVYINNKIIYEARVEQIVAASRLYYQPHELQ